MGMKEMLVVEDDTGREQSLFYDILRVYNKYILFVMCCCAFTEFNHSILRCDICLSISLALSHLSLDYDYHY